MDNFDEWDGEENLYFNFPTEEEEYIPEIPKNLLASLFLDDFSYLS